MEKIIKWLKAFEEKHEIIVLMFLYSIDWKSVKAVFLAIFYCLFFFWLFVQIAGITFKELFK